MKYFIIQALEYKHNAWIVTLVTKNRADAVVVKRYSKCIFLKCNLTLCVTEISVSYTYTRVTVDEGAIELRIHVGAGYRVYLGRHGEQWIVLLCGGDKNSQTKDIMRAKEYWAEWKRRQI
ncbi:type II toxin-antitoxin system RelE/ParE family toxin [Terracidiphilus sp.]|uniref:type II toxin-antitoxin system RelE/ParE family toxin n=1 Tax=Terracidiphilus sp. TaxID=1964191 RepID=UPI003C7535E5